MVLKKTECQYLSPCTELISNWKDLNIKSEKYEVTRRNHRQKFQDYKYRQGHSEKDLQLRK